uniref:NADH-ubiquinone oxidoreductase chain 4L n=1 Tax=Hishimonus phycitis TaxID=706848 RepID=A0A343K634_9HEMI|nr:NADH dehydrogenase subunit 4L [Hishimonus phycitis]
MLYLFMFMYMFSLISLLMVRKHIFLCLLSLEFIVLSLLMIFYNNYIAYSFGSYLMVMMMVFFVCEGVLGLSVLVSMIRCYSNDYMNSFTVW